MARRFLLGLADSRAFPRNRPRHAAANWLWANGVGTAGGRRHAIGGGCTSGHGVCGLANLSTRSLVATLSFMAAAVVTVFIVRHAGHA